MQRARAMQSRVSPMAHLNVRDRVIETTIAYVGPALSGKGTNFAQLRATATDGRVGELVERESGAGRLSSFDYRPLRSTRFNDCEVKVKLWTTHGDFPTAELERLLPQADGVVLVLDSDPAARARNQATTESVRDVLARDPARTLPIVVQLNKMDLPDAVPPADLLGALDLGALPHVVASATSGEGVIETLERAVEDVIEAMARKSDAGTDVPASPNPTSSNETVAPGSTAHPLLSALRQVLSDTIAEHDRRLMDRVERRLIEMGTALSAELARDRAANEAGTARLIRDVAELSQTMSQMSTDSRDARERREGSVRSFAQSLEGLRDELRQSKRGWFR